MSLVKLASKMSAIKDAFSLKAARGHMSNVKFSTNGGKFHEATKFDKIRSLLSTKEGLKTLKAPALAYGGTGLAAAAGALAYKKHNENS